MLFYCYRTCWNNHSELFIPFWHLFSSAVVWRGFLLFFLLIWKSCEIPYFLWIMAGDCPSRKKGMHISGTVPNFLDLHQLSSRGRKKWHAVNISQTLHHLKCQARHFTKRRYGYTHFSLSKIFVDMRSLMWSFKVYMLVKSHHSTQDISSTFFIPYMCVFTMLSGILHKDWEMEVPLSIFLTRRYYMSKYILWWICLLFMCICDPSLDLSMLTLIKNSVSTRCRKTLTGSFQREM